MASGVARCAATVSAPHLARMAELADAGGLNPSGGNTPCGFESRSGHGPPVGSFDGVGSIGAGALRAVPKADRVGEEVGAVHGPSVTR